MPFITKARFTQEVIFDKFHKKRKALDHQQQDWLKDYRKRIQFFKTTSPVFRTPQRLVDFESDTLPAMENLISTQLNHQAPQLYSAQWIDQNGEPLLFYLSVRDKHEKHNRVSRYVIVILGGAREGARFNIWQKKKTPSNGRSSQVYDLAQQYELGRTHPKPPKGIVRDGLDVSHFSGLMILAVTRMSF